MSETTSLPRPREVTTAAVLGLVGCVLLVISLFDAMATLRSIEMREAIEQFLTDPLGRGMGIDAAWVTSALHGLVLVNGALAAVAGVLAVFVLQRHQGARIGFSVAAGLLLFTAPLSGGLVAIAVAFAATLLWGRPARDWFAGRQPAPVAPVERSTPRTPPSSPGTPPDAGWAPPSPQAPVAPASGDTRTGEESQPAPAAYPFGQQRPSTSAPGGQPWAPPTPGSGEPGPFPPSGHDPQRRPGTVTAAVAMTWLLTPLVGSVFALMVLMLLVARDTLLEAVRQTPEFQASALTTGDLLAALWVVSALVLFWCLVAFVLAVFAFRRQGWARGLLVASAVMATLVALLAFPVGLVIAVPTAVSAGLLLSGSARAWYATRPAAGSPPPPPPYAGGGPSGYPQQQPPPQQPGKPPVW